MEDPFQLPEDMDPALKQLFNQLLETVMSEALKNPEGPREPILDVVDLLAAKLREHWEAEGDGSGGE
jgi:hypothetical protein